MGKLFKLLGLSAPTMMCVKGCDRFFELSDATRRDFDLIEKSENAICVASKRVDSFQDLGSFLVSDSILSIIDDKNKHEYIELLEIFRGSKQRFNNLEAQYPEKSYRNNPKVLDSVKSENKKIFLALEKMNMLLPKELREEQVLHYYASLFIDNWDFLNFSLCNFGYYREANGEIHGMTVDFGASGPLGFGGKSKDESYERAVTGARPENPLESSQFFLKEDAVFNGTISKSLVGIFSIPRSRPSLSVVRGQVFYQNEIYELSRNIFKKPPAAALNIAYRLSIIHDEKISELIKAECMIEEPEFPYRAQHGYNFDRDSMIEIMINRKYAFINKFGLQQIKNWESSHIGEAAKIRRQVNQAYKDLGLAGSVLPLQKQEVHNCSFNYSRFFSHNVNNNLEKYHDTNYSSLKCNRQKSLY